MKNLKKLENDLAKKTKISKSLENKYKQAERDLEMSRYYEDAYKLAKKLTLWFKTLKKKNFMICTGGGPGIMEAANKGAAKAKGKSVGLDISLPMEQNPNPYQTKDISCEFHYFFIRKFWFVYLAKALVVFPGGFGTMDEWFELLTLIQTHKTKKHMPVILYGTSFWKNLINFDYFADCGMISKKDLKLFRFYDDVDSAFECLKSEIEKHYL